MAAAEGSIEVVLPAGRGDILDRNDVPLADSVEGLMVVADPEWTRPDAPELAKFLATRLGIDYFATLEALRAEGSRFEYVARQVPSTLATDVLAEAEALGYEGLSTRRDPARDYPAADVAANLVGFLGTPDPEEGERPLAGFELTFDKLLSGTDGSAHYQVSGGNRIPLGVNTIDKAVDGQDLHTTIDVDLQWYVQRVVRQTVEDARGDSGLAIVMDSRTGELLAVADHPTFDATAPLEARRARTSARGR